MKIEYNIIAVMIALPGLIAASHTAAAQQYKIRQVTTTMGVKMETTTYVKRSRKRTENAYPGMANLATIEQCDLQRTITLNDKRKLYFIQPFAADKETVINEEEKTASKATPATPIAAAQKGGVVTMWYNITDTGERKTIYGLTARHLWSTINMKGSADACMKDSMLIKTDGWYVDLPQFTCPVRYTTGYAGGTGGGCQDRYVTRRSGKGREGFPLMETRVMVMGNGSNNRFESTLETLEFSTAKLDSMLFEIPPGYTQVKNIADLQEAPDVASFARSMENSNTESTATPITTSDTKRAGVLRIGVYKPTGADNLQNTELQAYLVNTLNVGNVEAVAVASAEDAKKYNCDLSLSTSFAQVKPASKVGGLLKAVRNADPTAAAAYNIDANLVLTSLADGSTRSQKAVAGKYEGGADGAARKALDEGGRALLKELR